MATPNKGYTLQTVGSNAGTWGTELNNNMISIVDRNMGGVLSKNISTTGDITLTNIDPTWEAQQGTLILTGNPAYGTYPTITISTPAVGFLFVQNNITLNGAAYPEIRIKNSTAATYAVVPANSSAVIILDTTNGARLAGQQGFASGTSLTFTQAAAPTGWTKSTTHNNKALRIVNTSGAGSGGTTAFTSVFTSRTIAQNNLPNVTLGTDSQGNHNHLMFKDEQVSAFNTPSSNEYCARAFVYPNSSPYNYGIQAASGTATGGRTTTAGAHTHTTGSLSGGVAQVAMDFAVQYVDAIICTKD